MLLANLLIDKLKLVWILVCAFFLLLLQNGIKSATTLSWIFSRRKKEANFKMNECGKRMNFTFTFAVSRFPVVIQEVSPIPVLYILAKDSIVTLNRWLEVKGTDQSG